MTRRAFVAGSVGTLAAASAAAQTPPALPDLPSLWDVDRSIANLENAYWGVMPREIEAEYLEHLSLIHILGIAPMVLSHGFRQPVTVTVDESGPAGWVGAGGCGRGAGGCVGVCAARVIVPAIVRAPQAARNGGFITDHLQDRVRAHTHRLR